MTLGPRVELLVRDGARFTRGGDGLCRRGVPLLVAELPLRLVLHSKVW